MASAIKKFFQKRKLDVKFKKAGEGHKLTDEGPRPSRSQHNAGPSGSGGAGQGSGAGSYQRSTSQEKQRAAEAALARSQAGAQRSFDPTMAAKARMRRELEAEKHKEQEAMGLAQKYAEPQEVVKDGAHNAPILFKCPEIGDAVLPKEEMIAYIHEFLLGQLGEEPEMASSLMIHTLNTDREKVKVCVDTLCKYLDNITNNPAEEKFRKVRVSNKAFSERIAPLKGTEEFLQAAGFMMKMLPFEDHEEGFYVMDAELAQDVERLGNIKAVLLASEPLKPQLDRALKVFYPSSGATNFTIPDEFYTISPEEMKKEQKRKQDAVEQLGMLRTKAMREREERRELLKYRYALIRIRLPDGNIIQGTFKANEKISALQQFVRENLVNDWMPFDLCTQIGEKLNCEDKSLAECGLPPAGVVNLSWDRTVMNEVQAQKGTSESTSVLKPEIMALIQDMR